MPARLHEKKNYIYHQRVHTVIHVWNQIIFNPRNCKFFRKIKLAKQSLPLLSYFQVYTSLPGRKRGWNVLAFHEYMIFCCELNTTHNAVSVIRCELVCFIMCSFSATQPVDLMVTDAILLLNSWYPPTLHNGLKEKMEIRAQAKYDSRFFYIISFTIQVKENNGFLYIIKQELLTGSKRKSGNSRKQKGIMACIGIHINIETDSPPKPSVT